VIFGHVSLPAVLGGELFNPESYMHRPFETHALLSFAPRPTNILTGIVSQVNSISSAITLALHRQS
jgi:hypothetical protein